MNHQNPNQQTDFHEFPKPSDPFDYSPSNNNNIQVTNMYQNLQMTPPRHQILDQCEFQRLPLPFEPLPDQIGHARLKKIIQNKGNYENKKKTNDEINKYIVELASSGKMAKKISISV